MPVICVGNLTTGGTGKTPMVVWVVRQLQRMGHRPAVLSRGYKAVAGHSDEAALLRRLCGVDVVVDADRLAGARQALQHGTDVLVMDDGFQHRRLRRTLDIVLIDATNPFGYGHCLPRGLLREPPSALRDAHAIVITRSDHLDEQNGSLTRLKARIGQLAPRASVHCAAHRPVAVIDETGARRPVEWLKGRRLLLFCGLGNPEAFRDTVAALAGDSPDAGVIGLEAFDDHHAYSQADADRLSALAARRGAGLLTSEKDYAKIDPADERKDTPRFSQPVWRLAVEMEVTEGAAELAELLKASCKV
jgi:tetraacyldisaccharide 4'-kinase